MNKYEVRASAINAVTGEEVEWGVYPAGADPLSVPKIQAGPFKVEEQARAACQRLNGTPEHDDNGED